MEEDQKKRGPKPNGTPLGTPLASKPKPPAYLSAEAKRHWKELVEVVSAAGLSSQLDRDSLTLYCTLWARWRIAEDVVAGKHSKADQTMPSGDVIRASNGYLQTNPWYQVATNALKDMKPFLDRFGLSPMARSKFKLPEGDDDGGSKWEGID